MSDLDNLAAMEAARQAVYRYCRAVDRLDPELLRSAFHADAEIDLGAIYAGGLDGFVDVAMGFMGAMAATRHDVTNIIVLGRGRDQIALESYVRTWHWIAAPDGDRELVVHGRYLDRMECRDGVWASAWHSELMDWGNERATDASWFKTNNELEKGRRDRKDGSYALRVSSGGA